jgi:hypothetical protein
MMEYQVSRFLLLRARSDKEWRRRRRGKKE